MSFEITGDGTLKGLGSGDPKDMASFKTAVRKTYNGRCLAIISPKERRGIIKIYARSPGLPSSEISIQVQ
ncbi:MAG: hypothetical protein NVS9B7_17820 [Flavisolibacter sp.]